MTIDERLKKLNKEQLKAVTHQDGPMLIVAGAGTGKTTVLVNRLLYLLEKKIANTDEVLLITFTEKAAGEMEERALELLPYGAFDLWINTFHKFCERILRDHALDIGLDSGFKLLTDTDQWILIKKNINRFNLDYYRPLGNPDKFIYELIRHFSRLKDEDIVESEYSNCVLEKKKNLDLMLSGAKNKSKNKKGADDENEMEVARLNELADAYQVYNALLLENGALDFGDLIRYVIKLLKERPNILKAYQEKFKYIMVDEFQDTNWSQYELIKILTGKKENLMVVGDDDQAVYVFRGASMANIMQYMDDYPKAKQVVLTDNYRSGQKILDASYDFIKNNNPNRLEAKLKIDKKLKSHSDDAGEVIHNIFANEEEETNWVAETIMDIFKNGKDVKLSDFAVLVRANSTADKFIEEFRRRDIPHIFLSARGLYFKPIILDVLAYFRLLDNYHESSALYRVLNMETFKISHADLISINKFARNKVWSLYEAIRNINAISGLSPETVRHIGDLCFLIDKHSKLAQADKPSKLFVNLVWDAGLNKKDHDQSRDYYSFLNQFYQKIKRFEEANPDARLKDFVELVDMEMEAGDTGSLKLDFEDNETVKVLTVHGAKGLEFDYVFIVDLVDKRFPTINRKEKITIPDELVKEVLPTGKEVHVEEERRLFYVALTRARRKVYLTSAKDVGGARLKQISSFVRELGFEDKQEVGPVKQDKSELMRDLAYARREDSDREEKYPIPLRYSFSQIEAFSNCPLQYKFNFVLKIPVMTKPNFIFGRVMHDTLRDFFMEAAEPDSATRQASLFKNVLRQVVFKPDRDHLLELYKARWRDDGYESKEQREEYKKRGWKIFKDFFTHHEKNGWPNVVFVEKNFSHKIGGYIFKGAIDRVDLKADGSIGIVDYKTGNPKEKLTYKEKKQLILYMIFIEEALRRKVSELTFYYLENNTAQSFSASRKDIDKLKEELLNTINEIKKCNFAPNPSILCRYCDFRNICDFRQ